MKAIRKPAFLFLSLLLPLLFASCSNSTEPERKTNPICFTVSQYEAKVVVNNLWDGSGSQQVDLTGIAAAEVKVSRAGESHTMVFTNVVKDGWVIASFNAVIDGKSYSYPANRCL